MHKQNFNLIYSDNELDIFIEKKNFGRGSEPVGAICHVPLGGFQGFPPRVTVGRSFIPFRAPVGSFYVEASHTSATHSRTKSSISWGLN